MTTENDYTYDIEDDCPQFVGAVFEELAGQPVTVEKLVELYKPPKPNNMTTLVAIHRKDTGDKTANQTDVKSKLITEVFTHARNKDGGSAFGYDEDEKTWRLVDEFGEPVDIHRVKYGDHLLIRPRTLPDLFNPVTGLWRNGHREVDLTKREKLRESMKAHGWPKHLEAIIDENDVSIVGGAQLTMAKELGIPPRVKKVTFGEGEAADAERIRLAVTSNSGREGYSPAERQKIAADLYDGKTWTQQKLAELLKVTAMQVSRDLRNLTDVKSSGPKRGRPRKNKTVVPKPKTGSGATPNVPTPNGSGANGSTPSGSTPNGSTPNGSGPETLEHGGSGPETQTPNVGTNNSSGSPGSSGKPATVHRILGGFNDDEWELPFDKDEMKILEEVARKAYAARPKSPRPPYTVNAVYDRYTFEASLTTNYMEVLFEMPRFKKTLAGLNRDRLVSALASADSLRGRWQTLLDKHDAELVKQMTIEDALRA